MKKLVLIIIFGLAILLIGVLAWWQFFSKPKTFSISLDATPQPTPKPLLAYTFDSLSQRQYQASQITIDRELEEYSGEKYKSSLFFFESDGYKVSGQINIPMTSKSNKMPVIIMLRGYVNQEIYKTGIGTNKAAGVFADNGYVTLAPDFLGYGQSDNPQNDVWWERLNNPVVVLNLLAALQTLDFIDPARVGIWAHSNGGQIAISVLEISGKPIPTTLWAPVTKPFPYSILYYTDEFDDEGKALRKELSRFEKDYDVSQYSITNYLDKIKAPLQIHQGTADDAVPVEWSQEFSDKLDELEIDHDFYIYSGADHNMLGSWNKVVERDLDFFNDKL